MNETVWNTVTRAGLAVMAGTALAGAPAVSTGADTNHPPPVSESAQSPRPVNSVNPMLRYQEPDQLTGRILSAGAGPQKLLFTFKRVATRTGSKLDVARDYAYPDGKPAAREHVVYDGDNLILFELDESQIGARGSARIQRAADNPSKGNIVLEYSTQPGDKPKPRSEPLQDNTLVADMVGPFLQAHWAALMRGEKVKCRYIVVPRKETVGFTFSKVSEATRQGQEIIVVRMEPSSVIIAALVDPLSFIIEKAPPHRVLEYAGRTTPKSGTAGKWKDLDATTVFDWK